MFAASAISGAVLGLAPTVFGMTAPGMPQSTIQTISFAAFKYLGSSTAGFEVAVPSDQVYGWVSSSSPTVYADFKANTGGTAITRVCRTTYTGISTICSPDTTQAMSTGQFYDLYVNVGSAGQVYGLNISPYDYIKFSLKVSSSTSNITPLGIGINTPNSGT
jgi:hypothetical protein